MKRTSWLCGVAAAVLLAGTGLSIGVHAQPVPRPAVQNPKLNLTFTDATGLFTMKSSDLRSKDPLYQKMEQYYVEGRISENDVKSIMQQRVNSIGKLVSSVQNEAGRLSEAQIYQMVDAMVSSGGKFSDVMDQANATSSQMADAMGDLIPPTLKLNKDLSNLVMPAVETYISDIGSISMRYNEVIQGGDFSDAEKNNVNKEMNAIQSYVRLNAPSQMGTNARQLDDAITYYNDPAKLDKTKQAIDKFITDGGGPDKVREYWDAVKKGDTAKAKAIIDQMAQVARNKIRAQEQTRMTTYYGEPITPPATTTDTTPSPVPATQTEPEPAQEPVPQPPAPTPVPAPAHPRAPTYAGQQNADGSYGNAVNPNELRVPQEQQDALAVYERQQAQAAARQAGADAGAQAGRTLAGAASAAFPDPGLDPVILVPVDPDTGLRETRVDQRNRGGASPGGGSGEGSGDSGLLAYDSPFTLDQYPDTSLPAADGQVTPPSHPLPEQPTYHAGDGAFTPEGQNGYYELPDGRTVTATADHQLPPHHHVAGDGSFTPEGQSGYDVYDGETTPSAPQTRHVAGDGSFTPEGGERLRGSRRRPGPGPPVRQPDPKRARRQFRRFRRLRRRHGGPLQFHRRQHPQHRSGVGLRARRLGPLCRSGVVRRGRHAPSRRHATPGQRLSARPAGYAQRHPDRPGDRAERPVARFRSQRHRRRRGSGRSRSDLCRLRHRQRAAGLFDALLVLGRYVAVVGGHFARLRPATAGLRAEHGATGARPRQRPADRRRRRMAHADRLAVRRYRRPFDPGEQRRPLDRSGPGLAQRPARPGRLRCALRRAAWRQPVAGPAFGRNVARSGRGAIRPAVVGPAVRHP
ncbi:MAG: hypothetical protein WDN06_17065 [Asticcacaulis sp.]